MKTTVIIYGTSTGTCEDLAGRIGAKLGVDNVINVTDLDASVLADNENLILGTSTWGAGNTRTWLATEYTTGPTTMPRACRPCCR